MSTHNIYFEQTIRKVPFFILQFSVFAAVESQYLVHVYVINLRNELT